jgi:mannose-6-phosphate isomerase-like protein (cupin superfamily)
MRVLVSIGLLVGAATVVGAQAQREAQPVSPAPPPGSAGIFKPGTELLSVLKAMPETASGMTASPVALTDQYRINIVRRAKGAGAIAHPGNTEVHYIIEGSGTLVTGGTILRATAPGGLAQIKDGVTRHVAPGDVVVVPENSPHWYKDLDAPITYLEVRFAAPAAR